MCYARKVHSYTFRLFHYVYCVRWNKYIFFRLLLLVPTTTILFYRGIFTILLCNWIIKLSWNKSTIINGIVSVVGRTRKFFLSKLVFKLSINVASFLFMCLHSVYGLPQFPYSITVDMQICQFKCVPLWFVAFLPFNCGISIA